MRHRTRSPVKRKSDFDLCATGHVKATVMRWLLRGGGSLTRLEPETKGLVKKRMTVEEYSEAEVWHRVHWRFSEEMFLSWYIWLKDNTAMVEEFAEEVKTVFGRNQT